MSADLLWQAYEVKKATGGQFIGGTDWVATGLAMDSRAVRSGDIFIAMIGEEGGLDGHDYVSMAIENGVVAIIVSRRLEIDVPQIVVNDTFQALKDLAYYARERAALKTVIAITGSVGKTGVRDMVDHAFQGAGRKTHASIKSYNNHVGVPYSLATMHASSEIGVFEIGMNHAHEITPLSQQVRPDIAIITWIAEVHIEAFEDGVHGIVKAKSEIFDGMASDGIAILPRDNLYYDDLKANANKAGLQKYSFGENKEADAQLIVCELTDSGSQIEAKIIDETVSFHLNIAGKHIAINALSSLLAVKLSGGDVRAAAQALEKIEPIEGRGRREIIKLSGADAVITLIDESYNASPVAMDAAFKVLSMAHPKSEGRLIAILGDMRELGGHSQEMHEALLEPLKQAGIDQLHCCGPYMKHLYNLIPEECRGEYQETSDDLADFIIERLKPNDVVLVKGSLGSKMKVVVEAIRQLGS